jgi:hypothetical protein
MGEQGLAPEMDRTRNRDFKPEGALIEPVIGHLKAEHRMGRNYLAHRAVDAGGNYKTRKERRFTLTFSIRNLANKI